jgi:hypothetical protein
MIGFAFAGNSGIITTNLGKTATFNKVAGRERRVHHSKSLPLPSLGRGFFCLRFAFDFLSKQPHFNASP